MLDVRNTAGALIYWGAFEADDQDFTLLRHVVSARGLPKWKFELGRYPRAQFALVRVPGQRGDACLMIRALREEIERRGNHQRSGTHGILCAPHLAERLLVFNHPAISEGLSDDAIVDIEYRRLLTKAWKPLRFYGERENRIYESVLEHAVQKLLMNPKTPPEIVISRALRGRWYDYQRDSFLGRLEQLRSPHLNLLREAFARKRVMHESPRERREPFIGL